MPLCISRFLSVCSSCVSEGLTIKFSKKGIRDSEMIDFMNLGFLKLWNFPSSLGGMMGEGVLETAE